MTIGGRDAPSAEELQQLLSIKVENLRDGDGKSSHNQLLLGQRNDGGKALNLLNT